MIKSLFFFVAVLCCCSMVIAQNVFNPNDALVTYNSGAVKGSSTNPNIPANGVMKKWVRTSRMSWSTTRFKSYIWNGMAFRIRFPNNYSATNATKYPVIVFFHGGGEIAPVYDNENQLVWGAQLFEQRINNGEWNGFMIFPQETYIGWDNTYFDRVTSVLDTLQKYNNSDVDRVITMGLSSGGFGSIAYADWYSQRVAAAVSSSPFQVNNLIPDVPGFFQTPLYIANGGTDLNPDPLAVQNFYSAFRNAGGNIYRSYYVNDGHNTWTDQWNQKNDAGAFITTTYWNSAHKAQPVVYFQNTQFCADSAISARMAISPGFAAYEWQLNNATISGASSNEYVATQAGSYRVRFKRTAAGAWSAWTPSPIVISTKACAVDTLFAEHFNRDNSYIASSPYTINNFPCQGGVMIPGTNIFTEDATGVLGNRFLINFTKGGSGCTLAAGNIVWNTATPVAVKPNTAYEYSFYLGNQTSTSLAQIAPSINGTALIAGSVQATGTGNASWKKFTYTWNSGTATSANLGIINRSTSTTSGNDFAIDEIAFRPVPIPVPACITNTSPATGATITTAATATLKWNAATNATSYSVYLWTGTTIPTTPVATVSTTTYDATGLTGATQYKWYVVPRNANNVPATGCSANQTTFTTAIVPPACITNTSPANGATLTTTTTATLTWPAAATATSYDVYLWKGATAPATATVNVTTTTYSATALTASSAYSWYIVPKNASGAATGCATNATNFTTAALPSPSCVTNTSPAAGTTLATQTSATLTWPSSSTATSYDVYLAAGTGTPTVLVTNTTALTYTSNSLNAGTIYSWYIAPRNAGGAATTCAASNTTTFTTAAATVALPACVTNTSPAAGNTLTTETSVTLTWPSSAGATSYDVYLAAGVATPTTLVNNTAALSYSATNLAAGTTYSWYIAPRNVSGANTACATSNTTTFTTAAAAIPVPACVTNASPANAATLATQTTATLTWPSSSTATSYDVYLAAGAATPTVLVTNTTSLTYSATNLTVGTTYSWYIAPRNASGVNTACATSNVTTFTTAAAVTLAACVTNTSPANGSVLPSQTSALLTWPASAGATSYDVYLAAGNAVPTVLATNTTALNYYATGLTASTLYSWYVAPRNANGVNTACSATNKTTFTTAVATGGGNLPPVAVAGSDVSITLPVSSVRLDASGSYDPDGSIIGFYWFQAQGPVQSVIANNFSMIITPTGLTTAGTYIFVVQVTDNNGVNSYSQKVVTVNAAGAGLRLADAGAQTVGMAVPVAKAALVTTTGVVTKAGVYPNPIATGQNTKLQVHSTYGGIATVQVLGVTGNVLQTERLNLAPGANIRTIHTAKLRPGLYMVHLAGNVTKSTTLKLIVN